MTFFLFYSSFSMIFFTSTGCNRPYTFSPIITTGANPQAPTQRRQSNEYFPSGVVSPTSMPSTRLNSSNNFSDPLQTFFMHVPTPFTVKMPTNLYANLTKIRIFKNCMKNISANHWARNRKCCYIRIISINRSINFKQVVLCQI